MLRRIRQSLNSSQNLADDLDNHNLDNNLEPNLEDSSQRSRQRNSDDTLLQDRSLEKKLTDTDYEFLFAQLLEGVAHSWHEGRIVKFFEKLETRGNPELWMDWLQRFRVKVMAMPIPDRELAARLLLFGQIVQSSPHLKNIGFLAYDIGHELLTKNNSDVEGEVVKVASSAEAESSKEETVWEYVGADFNPQLPQPAPTVALETSNSDSLWDEPSVNLETSPELTTAAPELTAAPLPSVTGEVELTSPESSPFSSPIIAELNSTNIEQNLNLSPAATEISVGEEIKNITPEQFLWILRQDANLVAQMSAQLDIATDDPQLIVKTLVERLNTNEQTEAQKQLELAESWFELGLKQANLGNMEEAIAAWDKALELNPRLASAWHNRGSALGHLAEFVEAIASFEQALEIDPDDAQTWNDRAHALLKLKKWDEALDSWERAIAIHPNFYQFWYNRGYVLEKLGRAEESIASYEKALQMQPDVLPIKNGYSNLLESKTESNR
jgi:Flp pilus assembly protein TadD